MKAYNRLGAKPVLQPRAPNQRIVAADGKEIASPGFAMLSVTLGKFKFKHLFCIAEVEDEGLIGSDILLKCELGPVDILLSQRQLAINNYRIPILVQDSASRECLSSTRKVTAFDTRELMPNSYCVITVCAERDPGAKDTVCLVEPAPQLQDKYKLLMPCGLIDLQTSEVCQVIVCNPTSDIVTLYANTVVGFIEDTVDVSNENPAMEATQPVNGRQAARACHEYSDPPTFIAEIDTTLPKHLVDLYERTRENLNLEQRKIIAEVLNQYSNVFARDEKDIGFCDKVKLNIPTGDAAPIRQRPHKVPFAFAEDEKRLLQNLQEQGVIRPSSSPWASPIHLVRKSNNRGTRLTCDYRRLNKLVASHLDSYPLPLISDCQNALSGNKYFCVSDIQSAYFNIPVDEKDIPKTAIISKYGLFEFLRCPQGLSASPSCFQRCIELVLKGLQYDSIVMYLDDLLIYGKSFDETVERLTTVLQRLLDAGLKLAPEKTQLFQQSVTFLGSVISCDGIRPDPRKIAKISDWPIPSNKRDIRSYLGICNYYRRYIKGYAARAKPLTVLTEKDRRFSWGEAEQSAFDDLKLALQSADIMAYPIDNGLYILDTDASDFAAGAVLSQIQDGREKVIAYGSKNFTRTQQRYCANHRELLSIRIFVDHYSQYLKGNFFIVRSDHASLRYIYTLKEPKSRVARWLEFFSGYNFEIQHRAGVKSGNCDALSRCKNVVTCNCPVTPLPCGPCPNCEADMHRIHAQLIEEDENDSDTVRITRESLRSNKKTPNTDHSTLQELSYSPAEIRAKQLADSNLGIVLTSLEEGMRPETVSQCAPATRHYFLIWNSLVVVQGVLCRSIMQNSKTVNQVILPSVLHKEAFDMCHSSLLGGHFAQKRTKQKLLQVVYWYKLPEDCKLLCLSCDQCQQQRKPRKEPRAPLKNFPSGHRFDHISVDFLGNLPRTEQGNVCMMVVNCHFTKWMHVYPAPDQTAQTVARLLLDNWISLYGMPLTVLSDQGRCFVSHVFTELCRLLGIKKKQTSPAHAQTNGQTERSNRVIMHILKCYVGQVQNKWDEFLGCVAGAYRSAVHESTKISPNLAVFGEEVRSPADLVFRNSLMEAPGQDKSLPETVIDIKERLISIHKLVRDNITTAVARQKVTYDRKQIVHKYAPGDYVWYFSHRQQLHLAPKLRVPYEGPFVVVGKCSDLNYFVAFNDKKQAQLLHHNRLRPYEGTKVLPWANKALEKHNQQ